LLCNALEHSIVHESVLTDDANFLFNKIHACVTRASLCQNFVIFLFEHLVLTSSIFAAQVNDFCFPL